MQHRVLTCMMGISALAVGACSPDAPPSASTTFTTTFGGDGDGDGGTGETDSGDGDGDTGDGDGDTGDGDGDGDGDTGDGDGDGDGDQPLCPNGMLDPGEECDVGVETMFCDGDCTYAMCGDGYHNTLSEACDDGNSANDDGCVGACVVAFCGDSFVYAGMEECDDSNMSDSDDCKNDCTMSVCGDGIVWNDGDGVEECDDANMSNDDACTTTCTNSFCGDGVLWQGMETCDDGNMVDTDQCPTSCEPASCGDGFVLMNVEQCDDGNNNNNDGCHSDCMWENGGVFSLVVNDNVNQDNMINTAVLDFFNTIGNPQPTDYIMVSVFGNVPMPGAWCATRGDWYRSEYIAHYGQNTSSQSGNWNKWTSNNGMNWSATINQGYTNYWGPSCDGQNGSWCSEWGIGGGYSIVVTPQATGAESYGSGWNSGNTVLTIKYAASRIAACGF